MFNIILASFVFDNFSKHVCIVYDMSQHLYGAGHFS